MSQTAIIQDMVILYGAVAVWLIAIWTRGLKVQPTPAARKLLDEAAAAYAHPASVAARHTFTALAIDSEQRRADNAAAYKRRLQRALRDDNCGLDILTDVNASW